ncbi:mechanosensitive ion channel protein 10-like [Phoenix dactylifera]|uniref:Mechanosensitive ion channel protein n=1 Tax=Phoenix dactylifera TaxID=42345 RepID=A0A8B9AQ43_PHODC|nr:mechanosensitive ion channel protein 10-like [Phoenix dactylifera]XP_038985439.1 mechanosensitive ion channel protein 10-like [Phoenix dactylifera]
MDPLKETFEKKQVEVVLVIPEEGAAPDPSGNHTSVPKVESLDDLQKDPNPKPKPPSPIGHPSPEIIKSSSSLKKPPRPPQSEALLRRRSISKPKSRFVEQPLPPSASRSVEDGRPPAHDRSSSAPCHSSPNPRASGTPKTPLAAADEEEEEDEEIYKKDQFPESGKRARKWKVRTLIEWMILILAMGCLVASLTVRRLQGFVIWGLEIWKWCLMVTVICCGRLVTQWFITVLVFLIEMNFLLRKKVLYFVYGLKNSVQVCTWLGLVLLSWSLLFNQGVRRSPKTEKVLNYVSRALASLLIGSVIWLVKTLLMKILASAFHMNRFFDRIQESIFHQYVLQTLSGPPVMELAEKVGTAKSTGKLSFRSMGKGTGKKGEEQEVIDVSKLHRLKQEKVSAWTMKGLINVIRTSGLTTISNTIESFDEEGAEHKDGEITSEWEAKAAAYRILKNVAKPGCKYIDAEDLLRFFSKEEVDIVLPLFEGAAETGRIKKSALRNWVVKVYLDRKSLAHSLNDTKTAVNQLHKLATAIVIVVIIIITLLLMGVATTKVLVFLSSQLVVAAFMFGNTCKTAFEAIIFVFVMHPFDVGDRCVVDGVQMIVEEMNILTTVFLKFNNEKIYYPNAVLATKPISNFYRSPDMGDTIDFSVDVSTSVEKIGAVKSRIKAYMESKPNHWHPDHSIVVKDIVNVNKMNMALYVTHTMNHQNIVEKNSRRTDLVLEMKKIFEELSIQYHLLPQEIHLSYTGSTALPINIG